MTLAEAVAIYLRRESKAMATMEGADHVALIEQVARESDYETDVLTEAILDSTIAGMH